MIRLYAMIIVIALLGGAAWAAKSYYTQTQMTIAQLRENNAKLEVANEENQQTITKMQESNLAIVFAPNLLRAPLNADPMVEVSQMQDACKVLELFIKYSNDILNLNNKYNFQLNNQLDTGVGVTPLLGDAL